MKAQKLDFGDLKRVETSEAVLRPCGLRVPPPKLLSRDVVLLPSSNSPSIDSHPNSVCVIAKVFSCVCCWYFMTIPLKSVLLIYCIINVCSQHMIKMKVSYYIIDMYTRHYTLGRYKCPTYQFWKQLILLLNRKQLCVDYNNTIIHEILI